MDKRGIARGFLKKKLLMGWWVSQSFNGIELDASGCASWPSLASGLIHPGEDSLIDTTQENLITFTQAAAELPRRRAGRKCHVSTFYRWATAGCRGIVLESSQVGGTRCPHKGGAPAILRATVTAPISRIV